jgi:hypothetical protein
MLDPACSDFILSSALILAACGADENGNEGADGTKAPTARR